MLPLSRWVYRCGGGGWRALLAGFGSWRATFGSHVWEPRLSATFDRHVPLVLSHIPLPLSKPFTPNPKPLCLHTYHFPFLNPLPQTLNPCAFTHTTSPFRHIPLPFSVTHIPLPLSQPPPLVSCDCNSFVVAACGWCTVETRVITVAGRCWGGMCVTRVTRIWV